MTEESLHIKQLMIEKLAGVINEGDDAYLEELIANNISLKQDWEELKENLSQEKLDEFLENGKIDNAWLRVHHRIKSKQRTRVILLHRGLAAAVVIIPLMIAAWWLFNNNIHHSNKIADNNEVKLLLNNGKEVILGDQASSNQAVAKNIKLNIAKGSLSYSVADDHHDKSLNTLIVPLKQTYKITLSDRTEVWLNALSSLKFPFTFNDSLREVYLTGEAYFKVAKDIRHPFVVHTPMTTVRDLGTAFNVNTYDSSKIKTSLVEGAVETTGEDGAFTKLIPGKEAVYAKDHGFTINSFDKDSLLSWMDGIYYFDHAPLEKIKPIIYRWYGDSIIINDPKLSASLFTGALIKNKPLKEFLDNLKFTSAIHYQYVNGKVYLSGK